MRSETKIFNEWYFKKYGGIISIGTMTGAILKSWVRKGFDAGWQHQQSKVDELQKRVDGLTQVMEELLEEMKYPTATFEEVICCGIKELEQALKGGSDE